MTEPRPASYRDIRGWLTRVDHKVFTAVLTAQAAGPAGDLVEMGAFMGKSAVVIGDHLRADERFVVIDLFGDMSLLGDTEHDAANRDENQASYPRLTRTRFEANYLALHDELPVVVQAPSSEILHHVQPGSVRFVHVDASHLYAPVAEDCRSVKAMLRPGGVVAFDDWRNAKCPGVAAAIWESVATDGLVPVAVTHNKLYGVHDRPGEVLDVLRDLVAADPGWWLAEEHDVMGHAVLRLDSVKAVARRKATRPRQVGAAAPTEQPAATRSLVRDLVPPALARWVRSRRG